MKFWNMQKLHQYALSTWKSEHKCEGKNKLMSLRLDFFKVFLFDGNLAALN